MRTTLTIDDALDRELRRLAGRNGTPYRQVVNHALRAGIKAIATPPTPRPYRTKAKALGLAPGVDYDKVGQYADELDDLHRV